MTATVANYDRKALSPFALKIMVFFSPVLALHGFSAPRAHADTVDAGSPRVHLRWNRPPGSTCIGQAEVAHEVETQLGHAVFVNDEAAPVQIQGTLEQREGTWVATLRMDEPGSGIHGVRELREQPDRDCAALSQSIVVVLAMLIDLAQSETPPSTGFRVIVGVAGAAGFRMLPKTTAGGSLWLGGALGRAWLLWADGTVWLPVDQLDSLRRGGTFQAWQAGLALCRAFPAGERFSFGACAGGQLGIIRGEGRGLGPNRISQRLLAQSSLEAALSLRLASSLALRTSAGGALALSRPPFFMELPNGTHREIFRSPPFVFTLRAGLTLEL
jgi:hypothetical protein